MMIGMFAYTEMSSSMLPGCCSLVCGAEVTQKYLVSSISALPGRVTQSSRNDPSIGGPWNQDAPKQRVHLSRKNFPKIMVILAHLNAPIGQKDVEKVQTRHSRMAWGTNYSKDT